MKKIFITSILILTIVLLPGCGCQKTTLKENEIQNQPINEEQKQPDDNKEEENAEQTKKPEEEKNQTLPEQNLKNGKIYQDKNYGFEFYYNPTWIISSVNAGEEYESSSPYLLVKAGKTSNDPCNEDGCPTRPGDREELSKGDTFGLIKTLNPWFKILLVKGEKWVSVQLIDGSKKCIAEAACQQFLSSIPLDKKEKKDGEEYKNYNDFMDLISSLKIKE